MIQKIQHAAPELLTNVKFAWTSAIGGLGAGIGTIMELIPAHIGTIAAMLSCVLTIVLIRSQRAKAKLEQEKLKLEIKALKDEQDNS